MEAYSCAGDAAIAAGAKVYSWRGVQAEGTEARGNRGKGGLADWVLLVWFLTVVGGWEDGRFSGSGRDFAEAQFARGGDAVAWGIQQASQKQSLGSELPPGVVGSVGSEACRWRGRMAARLPASTWQKASISWSSAWEGGASRENASVPPAGRGA